MKLILILFSLLSGFQTLAQNILDRNLASEGAWQLYEYNKTGEKTILLIGNSICFGYRGYAANELKDYRVLVWANPYNLKSPNLYPDMKKVTQGERIDLVHFNIGLHGWEKGRVPEEAYDSLLRNYVDSLRAFSGAEKFIWASTTPITNGKRPIRLHPTYNKIIVLRNEKAKRIMREKGIFINNLYRIGATNLRDAKTDLLHWNAWVYKVMGREVAKKIRKYMGFGSPAMGNKVYVSTNGDDSNDGTINLPFSSIDRAKDAIRQSRQQGDKGDFFIYLREGRYDIRETIEFDSLDYGITIQPFKNEVVELSGGLRIDQSYVESVVDSEYKDLFSNEIADKVKMINLIRRSITNFGELRQVGFSAPYGPSWMELFVNETPYHLARWPNASGIPIEEVIRQGHRSSGEGGIFRHTSNRPVKWESSNDVWISGYFKTGYASESVKVAEFDTDQNTITAAHTTSYGFGTTKEKPYRSWYAYNVVEELDSIGEYYIDREKGILFFYSPENIETLDLSIMEEPFFSIEGSRRIKIKGISMSNSRGIGIYLENTQHCLIENCHIYNIGSVGVVIGSGTVGDPAKLLSRGLGNIPQARYDNTILFTQGGKHNGVIGSRIYNTGAGGVYLSGGDRVTLEPGGNFVSNTLIHDFNRLEKSYRPGIDISGVGNQIISNTIHSAPSMAIQLFGNEHLVEYNEIYDVCLDIDDQGAIYYGRDPSERGNKVGHNYFHHIGNNHRASAVYHDDGACGMEVYGNVFYKAGTLPALIGGGSDITYRNNIFIDSPVGIHVDDRLKNWSKKSLAPYGIYDKRLKAVKNEQPPYSNRYPNLAKYWTDDPSTPKRIVIQSNIFCEVDRVLRGNSNYLSWGEDNIETANCPSRLKNALTGRGVIGTGSLKSKPQKWEDIDLGKIGSKLP